MKEQRFLKLYQEKGVLVCVKKKKFKGLKNGNGVIMCKIGNMAVSKGNGVESVNVQRMVCKNENGVRHDVCEQL